MVVVAAVLSPVRSAERLTACRGGAGPGPARRSYVALSRDRDSTMVVLSAEAIATTPEELAELLGLAAGQRDAQVRQRYADAWHAAGVDEHSRGLLAQR